MMRFALENDSEPGPLRRPNTAVTAIHAPGVSLMVQGSQVAMGVSVQQAFNQVNWQSMVSAEGTALERVRHTVAALERSVQLGALQGVYVTAGLIVLEGDEAALTWTVGPNATYLLDPNSAPSLVGQDLRLATLRRQGVPVRAEFGPEAWLFEETSSIFCVGTPDGYQTSELKLASGSMCFVADAGARPFTTQHPNTMEELLMAEAGWRHGLVGRILGATRGKVPECPSPWRSHLVDDQ